MQTRRPGERIARAAQWLCDAHEQRQRFYPLPKDLAPRNAEEAYAIQDEFVALRARKLGALGGYKIALSTPRCAPSSGCTSRRRA